jgi:hypothetical protein
MIRWYICVYIKNIYTTLMLILCWICAQPTRPITSRARRAPGPHWTTLFIGCREPYGPTTHSFAYVARVLCWCRCQVFTASKASSYHGVLIVINPVHTTSRDPYPRRRSDLHSLPRAHWWWIPLGIASWSFFLDTDLLCNTLHDRPDTGSRQALCPRTSSSTPILHQRIHQRRLRDCC